MTAYLNAMRRYFSFTGRTSRVNYWLFVLVVGLLAFVGVFIDYSLGHRVFALGRPGFGTLTIWGVHLLPFIAASVRRIHDSDQSGWLYWLIYIPLLGWIPFLGLMLARGTVGPNRYGTPETITAGKPFVFGSYEQVPPHFEPTTQMPIIPRATNATVPVAAFRPVAAPPAGETGLIEQLERLSTLRATGSLSDEEFETLKSQLLLKVTR